MELIDHPDDKVTPFGKYEEEAIAALILDYPDFFSPIYKHFKPDLFKRPEVQYVVASVMNYHEKYQVFPPRALIRDIITKQLTVDDDHVDDIMTIVDRKSNPREVPALKDTLIKWAKAGTYRLLYDPGTMEKYHQGDFEALDEIFEKAQQIQDISTEALWFFNDIEKLFIINENEHFTTGFHQLDSYLNNGGPGRKEMLVWMAPTGVGKSIFLINNAIANVLRGRNVLLVTLELSDINTAIRGLGVMTGLPIKPNQRVNMKDQMMSIIRKFKQSGAGDLVICEYPPDEVNVDQLHALVDHLKKSKGWVPDIIVVDYLELMCSRRPSDNKDDYTRQKNVSTQLRGLAIKTNTLVFTATQTNRSGNDDSKLIDVTKMAESYGKSMAMDYLISINQTADERQMADTGPAQARLYIAKCRNGKNFQSITVKINYETMGVKEISQ